VISDLITQTCNAKEESMFRPFVFIKSYQTDLEAVSLTECKFRITWMSCRNWIFEFFNGSITMCL